MSDSASALLELIRRVINDVRALEAAIEDRWGAHSIAAAFHEAPDGGPEEFADWARPRVRKALSILEQHYEGGFHARVTLEQDGDGLGNCHILQWGSRTLRSSTLRTAFAAAGLGDSVGKRGEGVSKIEVPFAVVCYTTKIPLTALLLDAKGAQIALDVGRALGGPTFADYTAGFSPPDHSSLRLPTAHEVNRILGWVRANEHECLEKMPAAMRARLLADRPAALLTGRSPFDSTYLNL